MRRTNAFFRFFPPPRFLSLPAAGINISDRSIRFAKLKHGEGGFVLDSFGEQPIPQGLVSAGQIQKPKELTGLLSAFRQTYGLSFIRASLPEQEGYSLRVKIPRVERKEIHQSLELQLEEYVPLSARDAVFDYTPIECVAPDPAANTLEVGLSVMPRKVIEGYADLFYDAGLVPLSFELEAHAIARAIIGEGECGTYVLLDIGAMRTGISVFSRGAIVFTSTITIGGYALTQSIAEELHIPFSRAQELKESEGLWGEAGLFAVSRSKFSALREEIGKHLSYIRTRQDVADDGAIEKIILCGGDANLPGLTEYLYETLKTPIEFGNPWININSLEEYVPEIPLNHSLRYAPALGLAIRRTG